MALPEESGLPESLLFTPRFGEAHQCSVILANPCALHAVLQTVTRLKNLRFGVKGRSPDTEFFVPISLDMIVTPGFRWHNLTNFALANIRCRRQALWQVLELRKDTLTVPHLQEITFEWGSWRKLLPDVRNHLNLQEAHFTKHLRGYTTEDATTASAEEIWFGVPQEYDCRRESLNCYCRRGGTDYPGELPLSARVGCRNF